VYLKALHFSNGMLEVKPVATISDNTMDFRGQKFLLNQREINSTDLQFMTRLFTIAEIAIISPVISREVSV